MLRFFLLLALVAACAAFVPKMQVRTPVKSLAMKSDIPKFVAPAALASMFAPLAAFAAEGTGRAFGFDDTNLIWAAIAPSVIIFPLYLRWSAQQEGDDFFDGYEKRRNG